MFDAPPGRFVGRDAIAQFNEEIHAVLRGSMHFNDNQFEQRSDHVWHRCYSTLQIAVEGSVETQLMTYEDVIVRVDCACKFAERVNRLFQPEPT